MQCRDGKVKALARGGEREREERARARERERESERARDCVCTIVLELMACVWQREEAERRGREKRQRGDALPPAAAYRFS
jgi:hypothetical protein